MTDPSLAIVFPAFNEEAGIERAVKEALQCGDRLIASGVIGQLEVVVVNDGSSDGTAKVLAGLASKHPNLLVVHHAENRGLGAAVRSGLDAATCELILYTDADLPIDLAIVDEAVAHLRADPTDDVVSWYRVRRWDEGPRRFVYSIVYNTIVRVVLGLRVRDVNFAAKLVRAEALDGCELRSEGSFIDAELLGRLDRRGHRIAQFPAVYRPRIDGVSTLSSVPVIRTIMGEMRTLVPEIRREPTRVRA